MFTPTPVVALNRAIAVAELEGPCPALALLDALELEQYHLYHAARGDLLERLGRRDEAREAFVRAADLVTNASERRYLEGRIEALGASG